MQFPPLEVHRFPSRKLDVEKLVKKGGQQGGDGGGGPGVRFGAAGGRKGEGARFRTPEWGGAKGGSKRWGGYLPPGGGATIGQVRLYTPRYLHIPSHTPINP